MIRKLFIAVLLCISSTVVFSQAANFPDGFSFQALATDAQGHVASNKDIYIKDAILYKSANGRVVYGETFTVHSSKDGVFTITIGKGSRTTGTASIAQIDWSDGPYFFNIKVAVSASSEGGDDRSQTYTDLGTTQFWAVPYALYSANSGGLDQKLNIADTAAMLLPYYRTAKAIAALGAKENISNKSTDILLGNSDLLYPSQKAVKAYVDAHSRNVAGAPVSFGPMNPVSTVNGGTISGTNIISLSPADTTNSGVVTAGSQIFGGNKGFVKDIKVNGLTVGKGNSNIPSNTVLGFQALSVNTSGLGNTGTGFQALLNNTVGSYNTSSGAYAMANNISGDRNTAYGGLAMANNVSGSANTAMGYQSLLALTSGDNNTAIGHNVLVYATGGNSNTAVGTSSMYSNNTGNNNTALGVSSLNNNLTGSNNVALGLEAMLHNTSGYDNATVGLGSMNANTTGNSNASLGNYSLFANLSGNFNAAFGNASLAHNQTGHYNTSVGNQSLAVNIGGNYNTAIGYAADVVSDGLSNATAIGNGAKVLASNSIQLGNPAITSVITKGKLTTGAITYPNIDGTAGQVLTTDGAGTALWTSAGGAFVPFSGATQAVNLGAYDLTVNGLTIGQGANNINTNTVVGNAVLQYNTTGFSNTSTGFSSLQYNTTGYENTANGLFALQYNTTGAANTALGYGALSRNFSGVGNTSVGHQSLLGLKDGSGNTAIGVNSMVYGISGNDNTAIGNGSLYGDNTGDRNTAIGTGTLYKNTSGTNNMASGYYSLFYNSTGIGNAAFGVFSMQNNITGNSNTALGYFADVATDGLNNATAIGNGAIVAASNSIQLGNTSVTSVQTSGSFYAGGILLTSDKRLKQNISPLQNSLATILKLNPVHYQKRSSLNSSDYSKTENGFIAQEVQQTVPYIVKEGNDKDHLLSVDYVSLIPLLTKAIQEQQAQISKQSDDIKALKKLVEQLMQKK